MALLCCICFDLVEHGNVHEKCLRRITSKPEVDPVKSKAISDFQKVHQRRRWTELRRGVARVGRGR